MSATPFIVMGLPRSRTAWLSRFLTYGDYVCGHEELRHARSLDDVRAWFAQPCIGSAETMAAPWWRLIDQFAPNARIVVVRRPVGEVVESLMRLPGCVFNRDVLTREMTKLDRKLDQIEARTDCLSVTFKDLATEATCAAVFEHCLGLPHDHAHWAVLDGVNVQCDMRALVRYAEAYRPALTKLAAVAKHQTLAAMTRDPVAEPEGVTLQIEPFDVWLKDARKCFDDHLVLVGEAPGDWARKNIPLMRKLDNLGMMQIVTARSNGRLFGYLMTLISPSLTSESVTTASNTTFYADPSFPGLGMKIQRASLAALKERGVDEVFFEAGQRGDGPRISTIYKRLGARPHGEVFRLALAEAA